MKKGEKYATISGADREKAAMEKGKKTSHRTKIRMNSDPKTSKLNDQKAVDRYLTSYGFRFESGGCIYASPGSDIGIRLPMTKFVNIILIFYKVTPLSCSGGLAYDTSSRGSRKSRSYP